MEEGLEPVLFMSLGFSQFWAIFTLVYCHGLLQLLLIFTHPDQMNKMKELICFSLMKVINLIEAVFNSAKYVSRNLALGLFEGKKAFLFFWTLKFSSPGETLIRAWRMRAVSLLSVSKQLK